MWSEEKIITELAQLIERLSKFPNNKDFQKLKKSTFEKMVEDGYHCLVSAMTRNGGINYFKGKMGISILKGEKCKN